MHRAVPPRTLAGMRTARIALWTLAAALVAGGGGVQAAAAAGPIARQLARDDSVLVVGTRIACFVLQAATTRGATKPGIACFLGDRAHGGWIPGTYGVALASDGEALVSRVGADGTPKRVFRRAALRRAAGKVYQLKPGSLFGFPLSSKLSLLCSIIDDRKATDVAPLYRSVKVGCWRHTDKPLPGSFGVAISEKVAGVYRYDAQGHAGANVTLHRQPATLG